MALHWQLKGGFLNSGIQGKWNCPGDCWVWENVLFLEEGEFLYFFLFSSLGENFQAE